MSKIRNRCAYFKQKAKNIQEAKLKRQSLENAHKQKIEANKQRTKKNENCTKPKAKNEDQKTHKTVKDKKSLNKFLARMERRSTPSSKSGSIRKSPGLRRN